MIPDLNMRACALCPETEDLALCMDCGAVRCFEHRHDFLFDDEPPLIYCLPCVERRNAQLVGTISSETGVLKS